MAHNVPKSIHMYIKWFERLGNLGSFFERRVGQIAVSTLFESKPHSLSIIDACKIYA
jgi:hypothetical protein